MILAAATLVVVGSGAYIVVGKPDAPKQAVQTAVVEQPAERATEFISYQGEDGKTALELLKSQAEVQTKSTAYGEMVTAVNGSDGGGSKYWLFYVDGQEAPEGAATYVTKTGQTIEWKLQ